MPDAYLYALIIGCEAAFWVVLALALAVRYLLRRETVSRYLLFLLPAVDLLLLLFTALDLKSGTPATFAHGLATAYVGFTVAFGALVVAWADERFAHRFAGGPAPSANPKHGWPAIRYEMRLWLRSLLAWAIALVLIVALIAFIDQREQTKELENWFMFAAGSTFFWFLFGPLWILVFSMKSPEA